MQMSLDHLWATLRDRWFPEREVYVRSHGHVTYVTFSPRLQMIAAGVAFAIVAWALVFTARSYMTDSQLAYQGQEMIEVREAYEARIAKLQNRYLRLEAELDDNEKRFDEMMRQLSGQHGQIEGAVGVELALSGRLEASQRRLREVTEQRDEALTKQEELRLRALDMERKLASERRRSEQDRADLDDFVATLETTASERDDARRSVRELSAEVQRLTANIADIRRHQTLVMTQLEEATRASLLELERIVGETGVDVDGLINEIENAYRGEGGPFIPIAHYVPEAAQGFPLNDVAVTASLDALQRINSLRIAIELLPLYRPVQDSFRQTSGFGRRRHPITKTWGMHYGVDWAAPIGTDVYAGAAGVVSYVGSQRGYGNLIKIRHPFGFETRYAHLNAIHVNQGQRVARGERIAEVGNTGRSTGPHLHYEIRRHNRPLNPRHFLEAGRHVF